MGEREQGLVDRDGLSHPDEGAMALLGDGWRRRRRLR